MLHFYFFTCVTSVRINDGDDDDMEYDPSCLYLYLLGPTFAPTFLAATYNPSIGGATFWKVMRPILPTIQHQMAKSVDTASCVLKSDIRIQIVVTTIELVRILIILSHFNYRLIGVKVSNFDKICSTVLKYTISK